MIRWGYTERDGPEMILTHLSESGSVSSVLFVGAGFGVDYAPIIKCIRARNSQCRVTFSDVSDISTREVQEIDAAGGEFVLIDVLEEPPSFLQADITLAFGLFSPQVIWGNNAQKAITNIAKLTCPGGLIVASTRQEYAAEFEVILELAGLTRAFEKKTGYDQSVAYDKHQFRKGWKGWSLGHHYPGYEHFDNLDDAYLAYLNEQIRRTNFYIENDTIIS